MLNMQKTEYAMRQKHYTGCEFIYDDFIHFNQH